MNVLSVSGGNDSVAMIQWAINKRRDTQELPDCWAVYIDTGWSAPGWSGRIEKVFDYAEKHGIRTATIASLGMSELVRTKKGWPSNQYQFCTAHLKGLPFLEWIDRKDPDSLSTVLIGKRRSESRARADTPEFIESSEVHGERRVWHPLYNVGQTERNALLEAAGFDLLPHRSLECNPCVNANRVDFIRLTEAEIERVSDLEVEIGQPMIRAKRYNALGIYGVVQWAKRDRKPDTIENAENHCAGLFGCGL